MKFLPLLTLMTLLLALLLAPMPAYADECNDDGRECAPRLVLKTTSIALSYIKIKSNPPTVSAGITFENQGTDWLLWRFYVGSGSDISACNSDIPLKWITIAPETGFIGPRQETKAVVTVNGRDLPTGTHRATICMVTNDPEHSLTAIPVTVEVK